MILMPESQAYARKMEAKEAHRAERKAEKQRVSFWAAI